MNRKRYLASFLLVVFCVLTSYQTAFAAETVEGKIINALTNHTSYAFAISDDHVFTSVANGFRMDKDSDGTRTTDMTQAEAQESIKNFSSGYVVRIDNGVVSMGNSVDYACDLQVLGGNQGVSISIYSINSNNSDNRITGTIMGNTLTARQESVSAYYFVLTESSYGISFSGDYQVSLGDVYQEQVPPQPVVLDYSKDSSERTITLTWTDTTPSGPAAYYEVYRQLGVTDDFVKVATVTGATAWTDATDEIKSDYRNLVDYYVISFNANGVASPESNEVIIAVSFWDF